MRNKKQLLFFLVPLVIISLLWIFYPRTEFDYYSSEKSRKIQAYNDNQEGGNSIGKILSSSPSIIFHSEIGSAIRYPYSGFRILASEAVDLTSYNEMHISIQASLSRRIPIILVIYDYKLKGGQVVPLILQAQLRYIEGTTNYVIPLEEFEIPTWWFLNNNIDKSEITEVDLSKVSSIELQTDQLLKAGSSDVLTLSSIIVKNNPNDRLFTISLIILGMDFLALLIFLFKLKYRVEIIPIPYKTQEVDNLTETEINKIKNYISQNYPLPINTQLIQLETGIPKSKIPTLIKEELNTTLKKLLTSIRLSEAKRLLEESDLPVNEIADQVGFGHVSHFNRVFKTEEGKSPNEYRSDSKNELPDK